LALVPKKHATAPLVARVKSARRLNILSLPTINLSGRRVSCSHHFPRPILNRISVLLRGGGILGADVGIEAAEDLSRSQRVGGSRASLAQASIAISNVHYCRALFIGFIARFEKS
jgi:hypothetical protein